MSDNTDDVKAGDSPADRMAAFASALLWEMNTDGLVRTLTLNGLREAVTAYEAAARTAERAAPGTPAIERTDEDRARMLTRVEGELERRRRKPAVKLQDLLRDAMGRGKKYIVGGYEGHDLGRIVAILLEETPELADYGLRVPPPAAPPRSGLDISVGSEATPDERPAASPFKALPDGEYRENAGQQCDMAEGPCACGAWHAAPPPGTPAAPPAATSAMDLMNQTRTCPDCGHVYTWGYHDCKGGECTCYRTHISECPVHGGVAPSAPAPATLAALIEAGNAMANSLLGQSSPIHPNALVRQWDKLVAAADEGGPDATQR